MSQCGFQCLFGHFRCTDNENGNKQSCNVVLSQQYIVHFKVSGAEYDPPFHSKHNDRDRT